MYNKNPADIIKKLTAGLHLKIFMKQNCNRYLLNFLVVVVVMMNNFFAANIFNRLGNVSRAVNRRAGN